VHEHLIRHCRSRLVHYLLKFARFHSAAMHQPAEYVEIVETSLARPVQNVSADHGNRSSWPSKYRPCPLLKDAADHLGRKSGRGVYSYRQTEWAQTTPISYVKSERSLAGTIEAIRLSILGDLAGARRRSLCFTSLPQPAEGSKKKGKSGGYDLTCVNAQYPWHLPSLRSCYALSQVASMRLFHHLISAVGPRRRIGCPCRGRGRLQSGA
jgi:hypothetical protein